MTPNEIAEAARAKIKGKPALEDKMRKEWEGVTAHIDRVLFSKKKWKNYEAHQLARKARLAMLTAFVEGATPEDAGKAAMAALEGVE